MQTTIERTAIAPKLKLSAEEKKAVAKIKRDAAKQATLTIVARAQFKAEHMRDKVLTAIESTDPKTNEKRVYHVTIIDGIVVGCCNAASGNACNGRYYEGHCGHGDRAMQYEATRLEQVVDAAVIAPQVLGALSQDIEQHVEDDLRSQVALDSFRANSAAFFNAASYAADKDLLPRACGPNETATIINRMNVERRHIAPLNGNSGFSLLKPERPGASPEYVFPRRQQESW